MRRRKLPAVLCALALMMVACEAPKPMFHGVDLTGVDYGRDFALDDPDGRRVTLETFRGRYVLLFFGFTQCPDVCPTELARAVDVRRKLGADGQRLQVVFVTLDPERDTPELLREYMRTFDPSFLGLRGGPAQTRATVLEFRAQYEKVPTGSSYTIAHSALSYVFDPKGRLRLALKYDQSVDDCVADLQMLMKHES